MPWKAQGKRYVASSLALLTSRDVAWLVKRVVAIWL